MRAVWPEHPDLQEEESMPDINKIKHPMLQEMVEQIMEYFATVNKYSWDKNDIYKMLEQIRGDWEG
jgi:hypothetical protein